MSDNAESTRALAVHLLHECIATRAQVQASRRLIVYLRQHNNANKPMGIDVSLDVADRALSESIGSITGWLKAQVVALHDPILTTRMVVGEVTADDEGNPVAGY